MTITLCWFILLPTFCRQKHCQIRDTVILKNRQKIYGRNINQEWKGLNKAISERNITKKAMF